MVSQDGFYTAATLPAPLSVVWGRFPYDEKRGEPGEDFHPCLVLGWNEYVPGRFSVLVVFGTSNPNRVEAWCNFQVSNATAMQFAGLNKVTYFDLGRWKWLQWHSDWFFTPDPDRWSTPVVGRIREDGAHVLRYQLQQRERRALPVPPKPKPKLIASSPSTDGTPGV